jgi:hypothetical protein
LPKWGGAQELLGSTYSRRMLRELSRLSLLPSSRLGCVVRQLTTNSPWLELSRLEDMLPDTGISRALEQLLLEQAEEAAA